MKALATRECGPPAPNRGHFHEGGKGGGGADLERKKKEIDKFQRLEDREFQFSFSQMFFFMSRVKELVFVTF